MPQLRSRINLTHRMGEKQIPNLCNPAASSGSGTRQRGKLNKTPRTSDKLPYFLPVKALIAALVMLPALAFAASNLPREEGAVYLEDLAIKPVKLVTVADSEVSSKPIDGRFLGVIRRGSAV